MKKARRAAVSLLLAAAVCVTGFPYGQLRIAAEDSSGLQAPDPPYVEGVQDWAGYTPISTKEELRLIQYNPTGQFYLTADIVLELADFEEGGLLRRGGGLADEFSGTLDGDGHSITGLRLTTANPDWGINEAVGLFVYNMGTIRDLQLLDLGLQTEARVETAGGFAAFNQGSIENCQVTGTVSGIGQQGTGGFGAIAGQNGGTISDCTVDVSVTDGSRTGGIAGENSATIENCRVTGTFEVGHGISLGGIVGINRGNISRCINEAAIDGVTSCGGIAGRNEEGGTITLCANWGTVFTQMGQTAAGICGSSDGTISRCANLGEIIGLEGYDGITTVGIASGSGTIENCYNSGKVAGSYAAGIGGSEAYITNCYNAGLVLGNGSGGMNPSEPGDPEDPGGTTGGDTGRRTLWGDGFPTGTRPDFSTSSSGGQTTKTVATVTTKGTTSPKPTTSSRETQPSSGQPAGTGDAYAIGENCKNSYYMDTLPRGGGDSRPLTAEQMKQADSFEGFDFGTVWKMGDTAYPFPVLQGLSGENPRILLGVAMIAPPDSTLAYQGEQPDLTGMQLAAQYSDGSEEAIAEYTVEGYEPYRLGEQTISIRYQNWIIPLTVNVVRRVSSLTMTKAPTQTVYIRGEAPVIRGLQLDVVYADGGRETLTDGWDSTLDTSVEGEQTVTVSVGDASVEFSVQVVADEAAYLKEFAATLLSQYAQGLPEGATKESVTLQPGCYPDTANIDALLAYAFTSHRRMRFGDVYAPDLTDWTPYIQSGEILYHKGENIVRVSANLMGQLLQDGIASYDYEWAGRLDVPCYKDGWFVLPLVTEDGPRPDPADMTVGRLDSGNFTVYYDAAEPAIPALRRVWMEFTPDLRLAALVPDMRVEEMELCGLPQEVLYGEAFPFEGAWLQVSYDNGMQEMVPLTPDMVGGFTPDQDGEQAITVTFAGQTANGTVRVLTEEESMKERAGGMIARLHAALNHLYPETDGTLGWGLDNVTYTGEVSADNIDVLIHYALLHNAAMGNPLDLSPCLDDSDPDPSNWTYRLDGNLVRRLLYYAFDGLGETVYLSQSPRYDFGRDEYVLDYLEGWGGPSPGREAFTLTRTENGWRAACDYLPEEDAGYLALRRTVLEFTSDFKLCSIRLDLRAQTLSWDSQPLQTVLPQGQALDLTGAALTVVYDNGMEALVPVTAEMISGFDPEETGRQTVTVTHAGQTLSFDVTVEARRPLGMALTPPDKTVYQQGEPLDLAGLQLLALYEDGRWTTVPVEAEDLEITGYDPERTGRQTIHVTWQGYVQYFVVEVTPRPLEGAVYTVENAVGKPGEQITIPVTMTDNPGLAGLSHTIQFDPEVLRFESVEMAGSLAGREPAVNAEKADAGQVSLVWFSPTDALGDGPAYILTFTILETAPLGSSDVRLSFGGRDNMNADLVPILFSVINGRVQVVDYILGDVDGNGSLGMMDALLLAQVLSGQSIELDEAQRLAADTDQNGVVELADVILLSQWLAEQTA